MKIKQKKAREFLEEIKKDDCVAIFGHDDLDGFASAMLFYDFCINKQCKEVEVFTISHGVNKISDYELTKFNKVIVTDLAPGSVSNCLNKIADSKKILYVDHHPQPKEFSLDDRILELVSVDIGYIPVSRTAYELVGGKYWLAVAGTLSDMGEQDELNKNFLNKFLEKNSISMDYMKQEIVYKLSRVIVYFEKHKKRNFFEILKELKDYKDITKVFEYEQPVKEELEKYIEECKKNSEKIGKITFYYFEPFYNIKSFLINYLSTRNPEEIFIISSPKNQDMIGLSARNSSKEYDVSKILKEATAGLNNASSGGHKMAAGGNIKKKDLKKFKENLKKCNLADSKMKDD